MRRILMVFFAITVIAGCKTQNEESIQTKGTERTIEKKGEWGTMKVSFPVYNNQYADSVIHKFTSGLISEFMKYTKNAVEDEMKYEMTVSYEEFFAKPGIVSVVFNIYEYTGGAHGNTFIQSLVLDSKNNKKLDLSDFVKPEQFTKVRSVVRKKLKEMLEYDESIEEGTSSPEDFSAFAVTNDKIIFWFSPYQVASYADGTQKVEISRK
jgi:hypothetical protein